MGFRIGGLLAAGALCILVILQVSHSSNSSNQSMVTFAHPPARVAAGSEVRLCAKAKESKLLKSVEFSPAKGHVTVLFSYTGSKSSNKKVLDGGVLTFEPRCRTYEVPLTVKGKEEVIPIYLTLHGEVEDVLRLHVYSSSP